MGLNRSRTLRPFGTGDATVFTTSGNSDDFIGDGWHPTEYAYGWTDGERALMFIELAVPIIGDLALSFTLRPYQNQSIEYQNVNVAVNGESVATWRVTGISDYPAIIPGSLASDGELRITLGIGSPTAPCRIRASADCRVLGWR